MTTYFVVADTHGFKSLLAAALKQNGFQYRNPDHKLILCGDLFDRGAEAVEILRYVKTLKDRFIYVRGNHEDLLYHCINEMDEHEWPNSCHFSNGTFDTIMQFCHMSKYDFADYYYEFNGCKYKDFLKILHSKLDPVLAYITDHSVNYFELDNYIFVHGWLPENYTVAGDDAWSKARWLNGMENWKYQSKHDRLPTNKTVVCGHWHTSFGNSHYHLSEHLQEWPQKNKPNWQESFKPFIDTGIVALDGCVAYSGRVNVYKINVE